MAMHVRKNDVVEVISGDHRGSKGKVLRVDPDRGMVVVEGINMVFRHVRPTRRNPQGGRVQKEAAIPASKVLPYDSAKGKGQRVRFTMQRDAAGHVVTKKRVTLAGTTLHTLSKSQQGN